MGPEAAYCLLWDWEYYARPNQLLPDGDWVYWLLLAGRGFGKTRTGAETVRQWARRHEYVNLIGATSDDARDIMIEGESGILAICPPDERPDYIKHQRKLIWPSGATSLIFTADEPDRLRGKQHEKLWCDEVAAWRYPDAWDQAKLGLRLGASPQAVLSTTPRPNKIIKTLVNDKNCHVTVGTTYDNRENLAPSFFGEIIKQYEGTRIGRQELMAEILDDTPGALWRTDLIDRVENHPDLVRVVVSVDPAVSNNEGSDETGIIAAGICAEGHIYVLGDHSGKYSPVDWARQAVALYHRVDADVIVAEVNQGGDMIEATLQTVAPFINVAKVRATRGKVTRAEPIAALYEQGRVSHVGKFTELESQMVAFTSDFDRSRQGYSPDRVDALVWALTELLPSATVRQNDYNDYIDYRDEIGGASSVTGY